MVRHQWAAERGVCGAVMRSPPTSVSANAYGLFTIESCGLGLKAPVSDSGNIT